MSEQLRRHLDILRSLPKASMAISTADVHKRLQDQGFTCSRRTIERDLLLLADIFPHAISVQHDESTRTNHWGLHDNKALLPDVLIGNPEFALAMTLLKQQAYSRLPLRIFKILDPLWQQASAAAQQNQNARKWLGFTRYLPNPLRPESPAIKENVQDTIEQALLYEDVLDLHVETLDGSMHYSRLKPLRLLQRDELMVLLAENPAARTEDDLICTIPMHRIISAESSLRFNDASDIDPDIAQQHALGQGDTLQLQIKVNRKLAEALFERPMGTAQTIKPCNEKESWYIVDTIIEDCPQLREWLKRRELNDELLVLKGFNA